MEYIRSSPIEFTIKLPTFFRVILKRYLQSGMRIYLNFDAIIVNNPVKARPCKGPEEWRWRGYIPTAFGKGAPEFITVDRILGQFCK